MSNHFAPAVSLTVFFLRVCSFFKSAGGTYRPSCNSLSFDHREGCCELLLAAAFDFFPAWPVPGIGNPVSGVQDIFLVAITRYQPADTRAHSNSLSLSLELKVAH
ncbi:hypothetical protein Mapa_012921 [Marchantia paleacea]|nr:hypothetical protein Mapa_012921 [Marchantia paleacea]